jgi:hypothetical protein
LQELFQAQAAREHGGFRRVLPAFVHSVPRDVLLEGRVQRGDGAVVSHTRARTAKRKEHSGQRKRKMMKEPRKKNKDKQEKKKKYKNTAWRRNQTKVPTPPHRIRASTWAATCGSKSRLKVPPRKSVR